jgi:hypothetical protein
VHKEILRQRGAIRMPRVRGPVMPLGDLVRRELQAIYRGALSGLHSAHYTKGAVR